MRGKKNLPHFTRHKMAKSFVAFALCFPIFFFFFFFFPSSLLPLPLMKKSPDFCASKKTCHLPDSFECGSLVLIGLGGRANLHLAPSASDAHRRASLPALCLAGNRADASACDSNPPPFFQPCVFSVVFFFLITRVPFNN